MSEHTSSFSMHSVFEYCLETSSQSVGDESKVGTDEPTLRALLEYKY